MSHEILQPPYVVRQGASNEGREPEAAEIPLAGAVFSLREAVYAFPNGSTRNEYGEWVHKMRLITDDAFERGQAILAASSERDVKFFPYVVYRFMQLYGDYQNRSEPFNLHEILMYHHTKLHHVVSLQNMRACHGHESFRFEINWMSEFVQRWNREREAKGWPLLKLDSTRYIGRYTPLSDGVEDSAKALFELTLPKMPSDAPTSIPADAPTSIPADAPTSIPADAPILNPVDAPTSIPADAPTSIPDDAPTSIPADAPTLNPVDAPTSNPVDAPISTPGPKPRPKPRQPPRREGVKKSTVVAIPEQISAQKEDRGFSATVQDLVDDSTSLGGESDPRSPLSSAGSSRRSSRRKGVKKSKVVAIPEQISAQKEDRGFSAAVQDLVDDLTSLGGESAPRSPSSSAGSSRRSSRRRNQSRPRVPRLVASLDATAISSTLDVNSNVETPDSPPPQASRSLTRSKSRSRSNTKKAAILLRLDHETPAPNLSQANTPPFSPGLTHLVPGGVRLINGGTEILQTPDSDRERHPTTKTMNQNDSILWDGPKFIIEIFWILIPKDPRLDLLQQALVACAACARLGFPCYIQIGLAIGCIRCKAHRDKCSLTIDKGGEHIANPYARMLARWMLCWQIYYFETEQELMLLRRDLAGYSFLPGVKLKYMPGDRSGNSKADDAAVKGCCESLQLNKTWKDCWMGMSYVECRKTWELLDKQPPIEGFREGLLEQVPVMGTLLPSDISTYLDSYYAKVKMRDPLYVEPENMPLYSPLIIPPFRYLNDQHGRGSDPDDIDTSASHSSGDNGGGRSETNMEGITSEDQNITIQCIASSSATIADDAKASTASASGSTGGSPHLRMDEDFDMAANEEDMHATDPQMMDMDMVAHDMLIPLARHPTPLQADQPMKVDQGKREPSSAPLRDQHQQYSLGAYNDDIRPRQNIPTLSHDNEDDAALSDIFPIMSREIVRLRNEVSRLQSSLRTRDERQRQGELEVQNLRDRIIALESRSDKQLMHGVMQLIHELQRAQSSAFCDGNGSSVRTMLPTLNQISTISSDSLPATVPTLAQDDTPMPTTLPHS